MLGHIYAPEIKELIDSRNFTALHQVFEEWPPADVAECIGELPADEQAILFRLLPQVQAAQVLEYLEAESQADLLKTLGNEEAARVLNDMSPDDRTAFLEELPHHAVIQTLKLLSAEERKIAQALLNYPENSVGRLMTPNFV